MADVLLPQLAFVLGLVLVVAGFLGYRRGWKAEASTFVSLSLGVVIATMAGAGWWDKWVDLLNRIMMLFGNLMWTIGFKSFWPPYLSPDVLPDALVRILLLAFVAVFAYILGTWVATATTSGLPGRLVGVVIGCLNLYVLAGAVLDVLNIRLKVWIFEVSPTALLNAIGYSHWGGQLEEPELLSGWLGTALVMLVLFGIGFTVVHMVRVREQ
jgi:hypothetical protein